MNASRLEETMQPGTSVEAIVVRFSDLAQLAVIGWIAFLLTTAHVLEIAFDEVPCALCLMQRVWFMVAGLIAIGALADGRARLIYPISIVAATVVGGAVAVRQLYLQMNPEAAPSCGLDIDTMIAFRPLAQVLEAMTLGTGSCAEPSPIPFLALIGFIVTATLAILQWRYQRLLLD